MLSYTLEEIKGWPLYEQLYQHIKEDIMEHRLYPDSPLPSKRSLAKQLNISITTVENAYNQLLSEGYIYSFPREGFYVSDVSQTPGMAIREENLAKQAEYKRTHPDYSKLSSATKSLVIDNKGMIQEKSFKDMYLGADDHKEFFADFTSNATDPNTFPFSTWAKINREILSTEQLKLMTNSPSKGLVELRFAIAEYLREFRGIDTFPDNIVVGAGTETLYSILIQLLGYDKVYGTEDPGYEKIAKLLEVSNVKNVKVPLDHDGIVPRDLRYKGVNVIHCTPSHHFPTGITTPIGRRQELLKWANEDDYHFDKKRQSVFLKTIASDKYIIEDDYDSEFRLSGLPIPSLFSIDNNEKVIYMNTFTKSLASTIRISYMILPDHLRDKYNETLSFCSCPVSTFEQLTLARFIERRFYEKHINRMRNSSRKKRDLLMKSIKNSAIGDFSEIREEQSGLHFILDIALGISDETFIKRCLDKDIKIKAISRNNFMINYSSIPLDRIEEAVRRLAECAL